MVVCEIYAGRWIAIGSTWKWRDALGSGHFVFPIETGHNAGFDAPRSDFIYSALLSCLMQAFIGLIFDC